MTDESKDIAHMREALAKEQGESWSHALIKVARLLDEHMLARMRMVRPELERLRRAHLQLFAYIRLEGVRSSELAERIGISKQAISQLVRELESMGILEQVPDPHDGRAKLVRFVRHGEGVLEGVRGMRRAEEAIERLVWGEGSGAGKALLRLLTPLAQTLEHFEEE